MNIILASTSPIRRQLLERAGIEFHCIQPQVDERALVSHHQEWSPETIASELSAAKALDVSARNPDHLIIGADQVLAYRQGAFSKPASLEQCRQQLLTLRGNRHTLISAVTCATQGAIVWNHTSEASLHMRFFTTEFLDHYLATLGADCLTSVGGYKLEALGVQLFNHIDGDYFTVLGLPLLPLLSYLRQIGAIPS